ncbi:hypothetical protein [Rhodoplanes sp. Z2-YC6860]|uniref:hypothetical protein n=1 Tax=Rhodoplanes sp. Z2-YC6860 TaxID=674703 RepID=UPI00078DCA01|nr:hypothetical protein [Rhodoplanes sp. Z2-YC6860]AMN40180.1 hypothetical protein RHPLAN_17280 [Rhodoplanes sp. Z2-YC6860]
MIQDYPAKHPRMQLPPVQAAATAHPDNHHELPDWYVKLLSSLGRTKDEDHRIAVHEAGHALAARLLGHPIGGATVNPDKERGSGGMVWGPEHMQAFAEGGGDASDIREELTSAMPSPGEDRDECNDIYSSCYHQVIELMAGAAGERLLLEGEPPGAADDIRQARELALLFCKSDAAVESFIAHCAIAAHDLLKPYVGHLISLCTVLKIARKLDGGEIDKVIRTVEAQQALAESRLRNTQWSAAIAESDRLRAAGVFAPLPCQ